MLDLRSYRIGDLGRVVTGKTPPTKKPELLGNSAAFITPTDIDEVSIYAQPERRLSEMGEKAFARSLLPARAICFTCIASIGKMCITSEPSLTNQQINSIVVDEDRFDPRFVFYALKAKREHFRSIASGSATPIINKTSFSNVELDCPPLETQQRIAAILGAYDDLGEVNRRRVAVLEEMARGLFEEWFVRFRFPGHEDVPIVDTSDGPLPEKWEWKAFSELADFMNGFAFKPSHFQASGLPIVKIPELRTGVSAKTPRNSGDDVPDKYRVEIGDLLFSWSGTFAISEWTEGTGLLNQHLFLVRPEAGMERGLLKHALRWAIPLFDNQGVGATMKHIRRSALDHTKVPYPPRGPLLAQANGIFSSIYQQTCNLRRATQTLAKSRDLLLPRLISGQLSVEVAERELEEAA